MREEARNTEARLPLPFHPSSLIPHPSFVLGLDIGGANLKAATSAGQAWLEQFELWRHPDDLSQALTELIRRFTSPDHIAVTMTGELCDCFPSRRDGVQKILAAMEEAAGETPIRVWGLDGKFRSLDQARADPLPCAAANWLVLATYAGRFAPRGPGLLIDLGSTTTDLVPLLNGVPMPRARTDPERLESKELLYMGTRRTPLCALLGEAGAAEFFATTLDVYIVLKRLLEEPENRQTANGLPATVAESRLRLAHMLCGDCESCPEEVTDRLARTVWQRQLTLIRDSVSYALAGVSDPVQVVMSGSGEFLIRDALAASGRFQLISLTEKLGQSVSNAACAYAIATFSSEVCQEC
jgi:probable H4MPT-linked C1 transfer pathway protein